MVREYYKKDSMTDVLNFNELEDTAQRYRSYANKLEATAQKYRSHAKEERSHVEDAQ